MGDKEPLSSELGHSPTTSVCMVPKTEPEKLKIGRKNHLCRDVGKRQSEMMIRPKVVLRFGAMWK